MNTSDPIGDYFDRMLRQLPGLVPEALADQLEDDARELLVTRHAMTLEVSEELLMEYGVIPDTRQHTPVPWRWRLRWRLADRRERAAAFAYKAIAGHDLPEQGW